MFVYFRLIEDHPIMSFTLNDTGRLALLNVATQVNIAMLSRIYKFVLKAEFCLFRLSQGKNCKWALIKRKLQQKQ